MVLRAMPPGSLRLYDTVKFTLLHARLPLEPRVRTYDIARIFGRFGFEFRGFFSATTPQSTTFAPAATHFGARFPRARQNGELSPSRSPGSSLFLEGQQSRIESVDMRAGHNPG